MVCGTGAAVATGQSAVAAVQIVVAEKTAALEAEQTAAVGAGQTSAVAAEQTVAAELAAAVGTGRIPVAAVAAPGKTAGKRLAG